MVHSPTTIKFLCSYGGKILPRHPDAKLRYHGGHTRVIAVHRSISFSDLSLKLGELMMSSSERSLTVCVRCQLPTEDLDALVSITCDEDLANLIEEYDRVSSSLKIRAFLSLPKRPFYPSSSLSSPSSSTNKYFTTTTPRYYSRPGCLRPAPFPPNRKFVNPYHDQYYHRHKNGCYVNGNNFYLIHNGNHNHWL